MIAPGHVVARYVEAAKVGPTAVDVVPKAVFRIPDLPAVFHGDVRGFYVNGRVVPLREALVPVSPVDDFWVLEPGRYYVVFPRVRIPKEYTGFAFPRSTLNRLGILKAPTAVFDPGYEGEWNQTFLVLSPVRIHVSEPWVALVFVRNEGVSGLYSGHWQGEAYGDDEWKVSQSGEEKPPT